MSSRVTPHAAAALIGGASIAAFYFWYRHSQRKRNKSISSSRNSTGKETKTTEKTTNNKSAATMTHKYVATNEEPESLIVVKEQQAAAKPSDEASDEVASQKSSGDRSVSDGDYDDEDASPVVVEPPKEDQLNLSLFMNEASFSWSEEVERSYREAEREEHERERRDAADSPSRASQRSEVSSQDSGRATGGLASSLSPLDGELDTQPMYEFEIPNTLVGLIIGVKGKTIKELSMRTDVRMIIREHHSPNKVETHQICQVRGNRQNINRCLQMLRRRFPSERFPELNLQPVFPPPLPNFNLDLFNTQPTWLTVPEGVMCEVVVSSVVDVGHFFVQQPTHPSFPSLQHLDLYMKRLYSQQNNIPELPKPCDTGLLCAAPVSDGWFRAVTVVYSAEQDDVVVRFVDYGGYTKLSRSELRQIRTDLMSLPFQATECYLAHVQPVDGTLQWSDEAKQHFYRLCANRIVEAFVIGHHCDDKTPFVEMHTVDEKGNAVRFDRVLMEAGLAKASDPSKVVRTSVRPRVKA